MVFIHPEFLRFRIKNKQNPSNRLLVGKYPEQWWGFYLAVKFLFTTKLLNTLISVILSHPNMRKALARNL